MLIRRAVALLALTCLHLTSWAIGDTCGKPQMLIDVAQFGTPEQLAARVDGMVDARWKELDPRIRDLFLTDATGEERWRQDARLDLLNNYVGPCDPPLLDFAVQAGNLATVKWMLDAGADPSGEPPHLFLPAQASLFTRCRFSYHGRRPDGKTREEGMAQTKLALRMLIERGGKINAIYNDGTGGAANALTKCASAEMLPILLELGAERLAQRPNAEPLKSSRYAPLQAAVTQFLVRNSAPLARVRTLAEGGNNDLRGTRAEERIFRDCQTPEAKARCAQLLEVVQVSPSVADALGIRMAPVVGAATMDREACSFPETLTSGPFSMAAVFRKGYVMSGTTEAMTVNVGASEKPVILSLESLGPVVWTVRQNREAKLLGIILRDARDSRPSVLAAAPAAVPVYHGFCAGGYFADVAGTVRMFARTGPVDAATLNPWYRTDEVTTAVGESEATVGSLPPEPRWVQSRTFDTVQSPPPSRVSSLKGREALEEMVREGSLKRPTAMVFTTWMQQALRRGFLERKIPSRLPAYWTGYAIPAYGPRRPYPEGMTGPDAPLFVAMSSDAMSGSAGESTIFVVGGREEGTCKGPRCR